MISGVPLATRKTVAEAHGRAQVLEVRREVILVSTTRNRTRSKRLVTDGHSANRDRVDNFKFALLFDVTSFIGHVVGGLSSPVQVPAAFVLPQDVSAIAWQYSGLPSLTDSSRWKIRSNAELHSASRWTSVLMELQEEPSSPRILVAKTKKKVSK